MVTMQTVSNVNYSAIVTNFFKKSIIANNADSNAIFNFLCTPDVIYRMLIASELELPALTLVVKELETQYSGLAGFDLTDENVRRNVGRFVKYIMKQYSLYPEETGLGEATYIPAFAKAQYFKTNAVYR